MNEAAVWQHLRQHMAPYWKAQRIENQVGDGTPDVYWTIPHKAHGWVELKYRPSWPKRPATPVALGLRPAQAHWHRDMAVPVWVIARIGDDWLFVWWCWADGKHPRADWLTLSSYTAPTRQVDWQKVAHMLATS